MFSNLLAKLIEKLGPWLVNMFITWVTALYQKHKDKKEIQEANAMKDRNAAYDRINDVLHN